VNDDKSAIANRVATNSAATSEPLWAFVEEFARAGIREAVICPGSRSTPLALAVRAHPSIRSRVVPDERAAGFFALGMAKASAAPVLVICTSGTAAVNLAPAVVEAFHGRVPLAIVTADRPPEFRDRGSAQTIDQVRLFGTQVKWFIDLPVFDTTADLLAHVRSVAGRAVATAAEGPKGPVHINVPFREPLIPAGPPQAHDAEAAGRSAQPVSDTQFVVTLEGRRVLPGADMARLATRLRGIERGLIIAGPQDDPTLPDALARLAAATGYPILADPLSQARIGPHDRSRVVAHGDFIARPGKWIDAHRPEIVIRFGAMPTSKPLLQLLQSARPEQLVVDGDGGWREAALLPTTFIHADGAGFADAIGAALALAPATTTLPSRWADDWLAADRVAAEAISAWLAGPSVRAESFEPLPFAILADLMPDGAVLWAGNSMPVRDMDTYLPSRPADVRCMANRGANGIDGVVSSALGAAAADVGPVVLVVGDLSFLHDLNALVMAKLHGLSATIVLTNNDGGGIFSFLPQASTDNPEVGLPEAFEELFGTPHGVEFGPVVRALGAEHRSVSSADLRQALADSIGSPGVQVLEVRTDRSRNVVLHREAAGAVSTALDALLAAESRP
jgi:2-succinyl-5-enolpyruvyl-6-hydroxy-3-cyclohexene-1-carboxylate synthase